MMDSLHDPLFRLHYQVFNELGDKHLDHHALKKAWMARAEPFEHLGRRRLQPFVDATQSLLTSTSLRPSDRFITVSPADCSGEFYTVKDDEDEDNENGVISFGDNDQKMEWTYRHPETTQDSDCEEGVDPYQKYPYYRINDATSPITTTASRLLFAVAFDAPNESPSELKAAYRHQLSVRIDEARRCLNLDCFEYKPSCIDVKGNTPIPTNRELERFDRSFSHGMRSGLDSDSDDEASDEWLDKRAEPKSGEIFSQDQLIALNYQACVGDFVNSRCLRIRLPLSSVNGIRLMAMADDDDFADPDGDEGIGAVLILELNERLGQDSFASRKVRSQYDRENAFQLISDWTPDEMATKATRYYFYASLGELKRTAAMMAKLCPHIAEMLASGSDESNALKESVSVEYGTAPPFVEAKQGKSGEEEPAAKKLRGLTVDDVHKALVDSKLVNSLSEAKEANPCLKKAILLGYIDLSSASGDTVIHEGSCVYCQGSLTCTISDALFQSAYGGGDYEDGGEDAGVQCSSCTEEGGGNYITGLCTNNADFDSGKFHNHCLECPDFGVCIGDYREAHCRHCNKHFFRGMSGFACPHCGDGRSKPLTEMQAPPPSTWDGEIENSAEVWEAYLEREEDPAKRAMLRMMMEGPNASVRGSEVLGLMSAVAGGGDRDLGAALGAAFGQGSAGSGDADEECRIM